MELSFVEGRVDPRLGGGLIGLGLSRELVTEPFGPSCRGHSSRFPVVVLALLELFAMIGLVVFRGSLSPPETCFSFSASNFVEVISSTLVSFKPLATVLKAVIDRFRNKSSAASALATPLRVADLGVRMRDGSLCVLICRVGGRFRNDRVANFGTSVDLAFGICGNADGASFLLFLTDPVGWTEGKATSNGAGCDIGCTFLDRCGENFW